MVVVSGEGGGSSSEGVYGLNKYVDGVVGMSGTLDTCEVLQGVVINPCNRKMIPCKAGAYNSLVFIFIISGYWFSVFLIVFVLRYVWKEKLYQLKCEITRSIKRKANDQPIGCVYKLSWYHVPQFMYLILLNILTEIINNRRKSGAPEDLLLNTISAQCCYWR